MRMARGTAGGLRVVGMDQFIPRRRNDSEATPGLSRERVPRLGGMVDDAIQVARPGA